MPHNLAMIPARGGSKGIPRKNVRVVAGKPLLAFTIEQARQSRQVSRVIVSTDDAEIASVARQYGAEVIDRPVAISTDTASSESALLHALEYLEQHEGYEPDLVVFLQCTSPLMLSEDIDATIQALLNEEADSALAVTPFHYFLWRQDASGDAVGINHDKRVRPLRQQGDSQFLETGAVYVMRTQGFKKAKHRFFGKTSMYVMPPERCLEIDELVDLQVAEVLLRERQCKSQVRSLPRNISGLVLDFDGVFTDNRVMVFEDGRESVLCDRSDGWGLAQLQRTGLPILVLSTEKNLVVQARCDKLGIPCVAGVGDKLPVLRHWLEKHHIEASGVVYVGNDVNDLSCLQSVGCGVVVSDAHPGVVSAARIVLSAAGGRGALREITDLILERMEQQKDAKSG